MHQIPLKVFNIAPRNYEIIDIIISSKDNSGLTIFYEENTRYIPSSVKDKTLGYLKIFPSDFEKVINEINEFLQYFNYRMDILREIFISF